MRKSRAYETAIITGASTGIGLALARRLAADGTRIALLARRADLLTEAAEAINAGGGFAVAVACDVSDPVQVRAAIDTAREQLGPIDLLVANAGVSQVMCVDDFDPEIWERTYRINVFGTMYAVAGVLPEMMARRRGHIVGISSLASYRAYPNLLAYSGSKAALCREFEAIRNRVRQWGVDVTTICPGFIRTDMTENAKLLQPMRMELAPAVEKIYRAIQGRRRSYSFPWTMAWVSRFMAILPTWLFDPLAERWGALL